MIAHGRTIAALLIAGAATALPATSATASSDRAWAEFNARVTRSCIASSGIRNARPSVILGFDDRVGKVAMLVSDRRRGGAPARLCLYDKRTRTAYVDEAAMWSAPPPPPR